MRSGDCFAILIVGLSSFSKKSEKCFGLLVMKVFILLFIFGVYIHLLEAKKKSIVDYTEAELEKLV